MCWANQKVVRDSFIFLNLVLKMDAKNVWNWCR